MNPPSLFRIACIVLFAHLLLVFVSFLWSPETPKEKKQKLIVKTVQLNPHEKKELTFGPKETPKQNEIAYIPPQKEPAKQEPSVIAQHEPKTVQHEPKKIEKNLKPKEVQTKPPKKTQQNKKTEKPVTKMAKKEEVPKEKTKESAKEKKEKTDAIAKKEKQSQLLAKAKEKMGSLNKNFDPIAMQTNEEMKPLSTLNSLQIDAIGDLSNEGSYSTKEMSYIDELILRLKLSLRLPTHGDVKIKLTLFRSGKVDKLQIVKSESDANRRYIEKEIPKMTFQHFGNNFKDDKTYTFLITITNEL